MEPRESKGTTQGCMAPVTTHVAVGCTLHVLEHDDVPGVKADVPWEAVHLQYARQHYRLLGVRPLCGPRLHPQAASTPMLQGCAEGSAQTKSPCAPCLARHLPWPPALQGASPPAQRPAALPPPSGPPPAGARGHGGAHIWVCGCHWPTAASKSCSLPLPVPASSRLAPPCKPPATTSP